MEALKPTGRMLGNISVFWRPRFIAWVSYCMVLKLSINLFGRYKETSAISD